MRKLIILAILSFFSLQNSTAQTLFNYGKFPVDKSEYLRVYQKNALNKKPDMSEPALREYLELYSLFKMKVKEAEQMQLDTAEAIASELANYRKQVAKNYLTDEAVNAQLVREAYNRKKEEVRVAHLLLLIPRGGTPIDTMIVKNRIDSIYKALTSGKASFEAMVKKYSDDGGSKENGGDIGYISALQTVYPFENAAYNTKKGAMSAPFRSQFGYHILKVIDRRPSPGELRVAQILLLTPESMDEAGKAVIKQRMDSIATAVKRGTSFTSLVKQYSEDRYSLESDGVVQISTGSTVANFEEAAYALKKVGDVSAPIQTNYGYHLIKLVEKIPVAPYDTLLPTLKKQVEADARSLTAKEAYMAKVKMENNFKEYSPALDEVAVRVEALPDTGANQGKFLTEEFKSMNKTLFSLGGKNYLQTDFVQYMFNLTRGSIMGPRRAVVNDIYRMYTDMVINNYQEEKLAQSNPDFKQLMTDYRDGIMLFELMDRKVWSAAAKDTVGLQKYYVAHASKYTWEPGFRGVVYTLKDEAAMKAALSALQKRGATAEGVSTATNTTSNPDALSYRTGYFEFSKHPEIPALRLKKGTVSEAFRNSDGTYSLVQADEIFQNQTSKTLDEARGFVISEYQDQLEKDWNNDLRSKYPVVVKEDVFRSMVGK